MKMYSEADVDATYLADGQVTILGYGSQGRAHALNLKDSGFNVVMGLRRDGASWAQAEADGLTVMEPAAAVQDAAIVAFLTPDMVQKSLYAAVADNIPEGSALLFAHGFAVHFKQIEPRADLDVVTALFEACKQSTQGLVVDDSSWIGWQRITDFWDEHPYGIPNADVRGLDQPLI